MENTEQQYGGAVYIFFSSGKKRSKHENSKVFLEPIKIRGPDIFSQFGLSITSLGNIDDDVNKFNGESFFYFFFKVRSRLSRFFWFFFCFIVVNANYKAKLIVIEKLRELTSKKVLFQTLQWVRHMQMVAKVQCTYIMDPSLLKISKINLLRYISLQYTYA